MKLLIVMAHLPRAAGGASSRNYYLMKALARQHTVSVLALVEHAELADSADLAEVRALVSTLRVVAGLSPAAKRWQQLLNVVRGQSFYLQRFVVKDIQTALNTLVDLEHYDAVLFESSLIAGYRLPAGMRTIIDQHNLEFELLERTFAQETVPLRKWYNWLEGRLLKQGELERCREADLVLVTSERERAVLQGVLPGQMIDVVPNGVDVELFSLSAEGQQAEVPQQIIFTGTMDYYPNTQGVLFFARECWPLIREQVPSATWQIVGRNPPPEVCRLAELPGVTVTGAVPDVRPYLAAVSVAIAPLQIGSGTRLKILEAFAMCKPVVSTTVGCEGLAVTPGKHLLVADQPVMFAQSVVRVMQDARLRSTLGMAGRALVESDYSWEGCGKQLSAILHVLEEKVPVCL